MSIFLDSDDVATLTGEKQKTRQVAALRTMGIAFFVNPSGRPVVTKAALEGNIQSDKPKVSWKPSVLDNGQKA